MISTRESTRSSYEPMLSLSLLANFEKLGKVNSAEFKACTEKVETVAILYVGE